MVLNILKEFMVYFGRVPILSISSVTAEFFEENSFELTGGYSPCIN
jgi:hypothetical protein